MSLHKQYKMYSSSVRFFFFFILLVLSKSASSSSSLINTVCSNTGRENFDVKSCIGILQSDKKTAYAKSFYDLAVGIMNAGIANMSGTRRYMISKLKERNSKSDMEVFKQCNTSYDSVIVNIQIALSDLKNDPPLATYDLGLAVNDSMEPCLTALRASVNFRDKTVLTGNEALFIYVFSATAAADRI